MSAAVLDGYIYAIGGYDGRWRMRSTEKFDATRNQWTKVANMHHRRSDAGAAAMAGTTQQRIQGAGARDLPKHLNFNSLDPPVLHCTHTKFFHVEFRRMKRDPDPPKKDLPDFECLRFRRQPKPKSGPYPVLRQRTQPQRKNNFV